VDRLMPEHLARESRALDGLSAADRDTLAGLLSRVLDRVDDRVDERG
jgi:hypothetical protein